MSSARRIILVASVDDQSNRLLKIGRSYASAGYEVIFWGMDRLRRHGKQGLVEGLHSEYLVSGFGYSNWRLLFGYPLWMWRVWRRVRRLDADLIHAFELDSALPVALAARGRIPFLYDVQDNYDLRHNWVFPVAQVIRWLDAFVLSRAAAVIVPDQARIVGPFQRFAPKITVLPNCPPDVPAPPRPARNGRLTVLAVGHLAERRGISLLLDAVRELPEVRVLMAGRFTEPWLEAKARAMPQVEFRGWVPWEQAVALGYEADLMFAFYDPRYRINRLANAQKWFDAMMTGTPILSNAEMVNADWILGENIGYVCPYDEQLLAYTLRRILASPEQACEKGRHARRLFEQRYNWPVMEKKLLELAARHVRSAPTCR